MRNGEAMPVPIRGAARCPTALLVALAVAALLVALIGTRWGPGLSPDSIKYICAARNVVGGYGASVYSDDAEIVPLPYHPPFYPVVLAGISCTGFDAVDVARGLAAFLFAANVFLAGFLVFKLVRRKWLAAFVSIAVLSSPAALQVHFFAWTESLYIFLGMAGIAMVVSYARGRGVGFLIAGSLAVASAVVTRYDGAALIAAGAVALTFLGRAEGKRSIKPLAVFVSLSILPAALWLGAKYYRGGSLDARPLAFHAITLSHIKGGIVTALAYTVPLDTTSAARASLLVAAATVVTTAFLLLRESRGGAPEKPAAPSNRERAEGFRHFRCIVAVAAAYIVSYFSIYVIAITFVDTCVQMDSRSFLSVYVAALFVAAVVVDYLGRYMRGDTAARAVAASAAAAFIVFQVSGAVPLVREAYRGGDVLGFTAEKWRESDLVAEVRRLDPGTVIYSNAPDVIYIYTGKRTRFLPRKYVAASHLPNETYVRDLGKMERELEGTAGVVAYFNNITWRWYLPTEAELVTELPLREALKKADGSVYKSGRSSGTRREVQRRD